MHLLTLSVDQPSLARFDNTMCNRYRQAIHKGARIPGWSIEQFSEIKIPIRFDNLPVDVFPDRDGLVIKLEGGTPVVEAMRWGFPLLDREDIAYRDI